MIPRLQRVGRVVALYRYPIKSMAAQAVSTAMVDRYGIAGDRRYALRRRGDASGFPWLTASKVPAMVTYRVEQALGAHPPMRLRVPAGDLISCEGDSVARHFFEAHGVDVELAHLTQGMFDCAGLSIISRQTIAALELVTGISLDVRRFRPNIVIDFADAAAYAENAWVGRAIGFGDMAAGPNASVAELDERCVMINLDPDSGLSAPEVLKSIVRARGNRADIYAVPTRTGAISVNDVAYMRSD